MVLGQRARLRGQHGASVPRPLLHLLPLPLHKTAKGGGSKAALLPAGARAQGGGSALQEAPTVQPAPQTSSVKQRGAGRHACAHLSSRTGQAGLSSTFEKSGATSRLKRRKLRGGGGRCQGGSRAWHARRGWSAGVSRRMPALTAPPPTPPTQHRSRVPTDPLVPLVQVHLLVVVLQAWVGGRGPAGGCAPS